MNEKVSPGDQPLTRTEAEGATVDLPEGLGFFSTGQVLGERYEILEMLGRGGMGEVWRAFDLKLRVEVGLKALREDLFQSERRLDMLRQEVRAAREVVSPNVCRIFDLIEIEGRELVSMEYVDGATLLGVLQERGPLELKEAQDIASQFLAGLEAIHKAGLVHRDVKPENIMLTRAGRVVVMDFGLARQETEGGGSVSGTPAYMAPEHAAGQDVDARADVYSAGVVLAEMVSPEGVKSYESRQSVWEGVRSEPAQVPDSPWAPVIKRAVARDRERRQNSAHTLIRELEDVTLRVEGAEDLHPYPGLASFTEEDADYFFGREAEVEEMWRTLEGPPRMLALVGPSGAGKSSFLRAGLLPRAPTGWSMVRCTPGNGPFVSLGQALAEAVAGNSEAMRLLPRVQENDSAVELVRLWSPESSNAVLIIDQFEELFTLNSVEVQRRFAALLSRLPLEADVHVLLSLRDDFLMSCNHHEALRPIVQGLTLLDPPTGANLRRALVQPATKCGYRFEDDELVDEMLAEVEGERGALPLLAFAASRLWEKRDRDSGLLTRQTYHDIGGVGGALARHAEATMDRIGVERIPIVRELFRNLVTAEGTRTVREWDELLSIFDGGGGEGIKPSPTKGAGKQSVEAGLSPARAAAAEVLRELIDARLLTSYEIREDEHEPIRRVEIIHESLLANWPRLVRWQTQDADSSRLRDELRQAARTWDEHGRSSDYLWTGKAFREYAVWRENYTGGLSELEQAFSVATIAHEQRRKRRRRTAVASAFIALLVVLGVVGGFWQRSITETRRAEAANLCSLAQLQLENHPSATIAHAIASLEFADTPLARSLALEALWQGPTRFVLPTGSPYSVAFSPDGRWLLTADDREDCLLWPSDGGAPTALEPRKTNGDCRISHKGDLVACISGDMQDLLLWSLPDGRFLRSLHLGGTFTQNFWYSPDGTRIVTSTDGERAETVKVLIRSWPVAGGAPSLIAQLDIPKASTGTFSGVDPNESLLAWVNDTTFNITPLDRMGGSPTPTIRLEHERYLLTAVFDDEGRQVATSDRVGSIKVWSLDHDPPAITHTFEGEVMAVQNSYSIRFDATGSMLGSAKGFLCDLTAPPDTEPLQLKGHAARGWGTAFHPDSNWLAIGNQRVVSLWPLGRRYPTSLRGHEDRVRQVLFTPDSRSLVSMADDGTVRLWPLDPSSGQQPATLFRPAGGWDGPYMVAMAPDGSFLAAGLLDGKVLLLPLDGGEARQLHGLTDAITGLAVDAGSRFVAAGAGSMNAKQAFVHIWDLSSGETLTADVGDGKPIYALRFTPEGDLWAESGTALRRWSLGGGEPRIVEEIDYEGKFLVGPTLRYLEINRRELLFKESGKLWIQTMDTGDTRELASHGPSGGGVFSADGEIVISTDTQGRLQVGPATGEPPHLLFGRTDGIAVISPDHRWVAAGGADSTVRLWPMPDLTKPPLHTLPREELIAKLKTLTNLRVVRDSESTTGWKLTHDPFPGWETVPTW